RGWRSSRRSFREKQGAELLLDRFRIVSLHGPTLEFHPHRFATIQRSLLVVALRMLAIGGIAFPQEHLPQDFAPSATELVELRFRVVLELDARKPLSDQRVKLSRGLPGRRSLGSLDREKPKLDLSRSSSV